MAIMTKMRENMAIMFAILAGAFLITIVFEWGMDYLDIRSRGQDAVGKVEGKKISYQEFSELVRRAAENQKQQTKQEPTDETYRQIRDQVWNSLLTQILVEKESERMGIRVTDQEIIDWVRGENPPEFLVNQFRDSLGQFNRAAYESAINDPRNREIWIQVETALRQQRLSEKIQSMVLATTRVTPGEVEQRFKDQTTKIDAQYALFDPNRFVADSALTVTDDDIRKFYNENQEEFRTKATRKLKYVLFGDQPTAKDTEAVLGEMQHILQQIKMGLKFEELQQTYSETPTAAAFFKHGELSQEKEKAVFSAKTGDIVGPVKDFDGFHLMKILEQKQGTDVFVRARHILLNTSGGQSEAALMQKARELMSRARKGEDFAALARQYSQEPAASSSGGDLGWFGKGRMVKPFEDAALKGRPGEIIGPVKTQFGIHIIKIEGRDSRELKVANIHLPVKAGSQTKDDAYQNAQDFAYLAKDGKFEKDAEGLKLDVRETPPFQKGGMIPGIGFNESVSKFAFDGDLGDVSEVYPVSGGNAIFMISEMKNDGVRPFDEVKESLKPRALRKKKMMGIKELVSQFRSSVSGEADLSVLTSKNQNIVVQTTGSFSPNGGIPTVGWEPAFAGAGLILPVGTISQPIEGTRGYYLVKVLSRTPFDTTAFNAQRAFLANQLLQEKKQRILTAWLEKIKEKADIEDNRDLFFR